MILFSKNSFENCLAMINYEDILKFNLDVFVYQRIEMSDYLKRKYHGLSQLCSIYICTTIFNPKIILFSKEDGIQWQKNLFYSFNLDKKLFLDKCLSMGRFAQINSKFKQKPFFKVKFLLLGKFYFYKTKRVRYMMTSSIFEKMNSKGCKIFRR